MGGAFGHLNHPFEDMKLTFYDLKIMIRMLMGDLEMENILSEKTDGVQLSISWKNGELICARNKGHLKNNGEKAIKHNEIKDFFKDREEIENAFVFAVNDLVDAFEKLNPKQLLDMFEEGKKFMSIEIIYRKLEDSIPYNIDSLLFHGLIEYNIDGIPIEIDKKQAIKLEKMLKDANVSTGKIFNINGPNPITIIKQSNFSNKVKQYIFDLTKLQNEFNLTDKEEYGIYYYEWFKLYIKSKAEQYDFNISEDLLDRLARKFGLQEKSLFRVYELKKIENEAFSAWLLNFIDKEYKNIYKNIVEKFEMIFFKVGVDILKSLSTYLVLNKDQSKVQMKQKLELAIDIIKKSKDSEKINLMLDNLRKINELGGINEMAPTEGVCFYYKNQLYKIVGLFAVFHRIVSNLKFKNK